MPENPSWRVTWKAFPFLVLMVLTLVCASLPAVWTAWHIGARWRGIVPTVIDDDVHYYARLQAIAKGYPMVGNPFFWEHRASSSPVFVGAEWLAVWPFLLHLPVPYAEWLNFCLWSLIFVFCWYLFWRGLGIRPWSSAVLSWLVYFCVYWAIFRPVSAQTYFFLFPLVLLSCHRWLKGDNSKKDIALIAVLLAAAVTLYPFLALIAVTIFGLLACCLALDRRWSSLRRLCLAGLISVPFALPSLWYLWRQTRTPFYLETLRRTWLVVTRQPSYPALIMVALSISAAIIWYFALRKTKTLENRTNHERQNDSDLFTWFLITGGGLCLAALSNLVTARETETAQHVMLFFRAWLPAVMILLLYILWPWRRKVWIWMSAATLLLLLSFAYSATSRLSLAFWDLNPQAGQDVQSYGDPLAWLARQQTPIVVWSDDLFGAYVPIYTKGYVLYSFPGKYYLLGDEEIRQRFLLSRVFAHLSDQDIISSYQSYAGAGAAHRLDFRNRWSRNCSRFHLDGLGIACPALESIATEVGSEVIKKMSGEYRAYEDDPCEGLKQYHVTHIVKDKEEDQEMKPETLRCAQKVYDDGRFEIYTTGF